MTILVIVAFIVIWFVVALGVAVLIGRKLAERDHHEH